MTNPRDGQLPRGVGELEYENLWALTKVERELLYIFFFVFCFLFFVFCSLFFVLCSLFFVFCFLFFIFLFFIFYFLFLILTSLFCFLKVITQTLVHYDIGGKGKHV